jgi:hypothetical protein
MLGDPRAIRYASPMNIRFSGAAMLALAIFSPAALPQVDCNESWRYDIVADAPFVRAGASTLVDTPEGERLVVLGATTAPNVYPERWTLAIWDGHAWESIDLPDDALEIIGPSLVARSTPDGMEYIVGGFTFFDPFRAGTHGTPRYRSWSGWDVVTHTDPVLWYLQVVAIDAPNTPPYLAFERGYVDASESELVEVSSDRWAVLTPTTGPADQSLSRFGFVANDGTGERLYLSSDGPASVFDAATSTWSDLPRFDNSYVPMRGPAMLNGEHAVILDSGYRHNLPNEPVRVIRNGNIIEAFPPFPAEMLLTGVGSVFNQYMTDFVRIAPICGRDTLVSFGPISARIGTASYQRAFGWDGENMVRFGQGISFEGIQGAEQHRGSFYVVGNFTSVDGTIVPGIARWGGPSDPLACPADATGDGRVDFADLNAVLSSFGNQQAAREAGDVTGDAIVDFSDLNEILSAFGDVCGAH